MSLLSRSLGLVLLACVLWFPNSASAASLLLFQQQSLTRGDLNRLIPLDGSGPTTRAELNHPLRQRVYAAEQILVYDHETYGLAPFERSPWFAGRGVDEPVTCPHGRLSSIEQETINYSYAVYDTRAHAIVRLGDPLRWSDIRIQGIPAQVLERGEEITVSVKAYNLGPDSANKAYVGIGIPRQLKLVDSRTRSGKFNADTGVWSTFGIGIASQALLSLDLKAVRPGQGSLRIHSFFNSPLDPSTGNNALSTIFRVPGGITPPLSLLLDESGD